MESNVPTAFNELHIGLYESLANARVENRSLFDWMYKGLAEGNREIAIGVILLVIQADDVELVRELKDIHVMVPRSSLMIKSRKMLDYLMEVKVFDVASLLKMFDNPVVAAYLKEYMAKHNMILTMSPNVNLRWIDVRQAFSDGKDIEQINHAIIEEIIKGGFVFMLKNILTAGKLDQEYVRNTIRGNLREWLPYIADTILTVLVEHNVINTDVLPIGECPPRLMNTYARAVRV